MQVDNLNKEAIVLIIELFVVLVIAAGSAVALIEDGNTAPSGCDW